MASTESSGPSVFAPDGNLPGYQGIAGAVALRPQRIEESEVRGEEIRILCEINQTVGESVNLQAMVHRILEQVVAAGSFDAGLIRLADPVRKVILPVASYGYHEPGAIRELSLQGNVQEGRWLRQVLMGRTAVVIEDVDCHRGLRTFKQEGFRSAITVPVTAAHQVLGVLQLMSRMPRHFAPGPRRLLEAIGSQIGLGIQKAHLSEERTRLVAILEATTDPVSIADAAGRVQYSNAAARRLFGIDHDREGTSFRLGDHSPQWARELLNRKAIPAALRNGLWRGELAYEDPEGREIPVSQVIIAHAGADGRTGFISTIARDVTEQKRTEEVLKYQALHDSLTGLPNRTLLRERLCQALAEARRQGQLVALLVMDLDRFKEVNDTFGHPSGDLLLEQVTRRMSATVREHETMARLGGDEFALVLHSLPTEEAAAAVATRILSSFEQPFVVEGHELGVGISIGIALSPRHTDDPDVLLRLADVAMYIAKREGLGFAFYSTEQDQHNAQRAALLGELRRALEANELELHYQPKVLISSGRITGFEALLRWQHRQRGLLVPSDFLTLAEQSGLMGSIGQWVLRRAVDDCRGWNNRGLELPVAVNLSPQNLRDLRLPHLVASLLGKARLPAARLEIEITESAIMSDQPDVLDVLTQLHDMGVHITIDDFGTGYSSLVYLRRLPVDAIKIDCTFVTGMVKDENDSAIVRSTIDLGHNLGLEVVAEGVEDEAIWTSLDDLGCDVAQGYGISRPMRAIHLPRWARAWPKLAGKRFLRVRRAPKLLGQPHKEFWEIA